MDGFQVETATEADGERLATLRVEAMRPSLEAVGRFDPARARDRFLSTFRAEETRLVLDDAARLVGFFVVRRHKDHLYLDHLYVDPARQGRGIGARIVDLVQAEARAAGLPIRLMALNGSKANAFYRARGFIPVSADALDTHYVWSPDA